MDIMKIKVETYIPESYFNTLIEALNKIETFEINDSDSCICCYKLNSFSSVDKNSNLNNDTSHSEEELKVEFKCCYNLMEQICYAIQQIHPYKNPVINIFPLLY